MNKNIGEKHVSCLSRLFLVLPAITFYLTLEGGRNLIRHCGTLSGRIEPTFFTVAALTVNPILTKNRSRIIFSCAVINILV